MDEDDDDILKHGSGKEPLLLQQDWKRTSLFAMLSLLGYIAINVFWQFISSGDWSGSIVLSLLARPLPAVPPLGEILYRPLSVFQYPWMILVVGLLLGIVMFVPIVMAVLYRLPVALVFLLVTALIGNAPVLALTLAVGCFLAAATPLRSNLSLVAIVLGLIPVALYLVLSGFISGDSASILPVQRWIPYAPMCIAIAAALLAAFAVLGVARLTGYRPGAVAPVLLILSMAPLWLFYAKVGPAELEYALIVNNLPSSSFVYDPDPVEVWTRENKVADLGTLKLRDFVQKTYARKTDELVAACDRFVSRHITSTHVPALLYLKAQCQSLQLDERAFESGTIRMTDNFVLPASKPTWQRLVDDYSSSPQAAIANVHLGQLAMREGRPAEAYKALRQAQDVLQGIVATSRQDGEKSPQIFMPLPPLPGEPQYEQALADARFLLWMIDQNNVLTDPASAEALSALLACNPCIGDEHGGLCRLLADKPERLKTRMGNNIRLAIAQANGDIAAIVAIAADKADPGAAVAANFELGRMVMQKPTLIQQWKLLPAEEYFKRVLDMPASPWRDQATQWLGRPPQ